MAPLVCARPKLGVGCKQAPKPAFCPRNRHGIPGALHSLVRWKPQEIPTFPPGKAWSRSKGGKLGDSQAHPVFAAPGLCAPCPPQACFLFWPAVFTGLLSFQGPGLFRVRFYTRQLKSVVEFEDRDRHLTQLSYPRGKQGPDDGFLVIFGDRRSLLGRTGFLMGNLEPEFKFLILQGTALRVFS